jgi:hypothetical protein
VAYFEGHAGPWKVPSANTPEDTTRRAQDLDCNDLYVSGGNGWVRLEPNDVDNRSNWRERPYGWVNAPR